MRGTGVVGIAVAALAIPAMAFAQGQGAWCGGSYGSEGTNFGPCRGGPANPQVAGQVSGVQAQSIQTAPQYPANQVILRDGRAYHNGQELNLSPRPFPDRTELPSPGARTQDHRRRAAVTR